jgi:hypothetical protein
MKQNQLNTEDIISLCLSLISGIPFDKDQVSKQILNLCITCLESPDKFSFEEIVVPLCLLSSDFISNLKENLRILFSYLDNDIERGEINFKTLNSFLLSLLKLIK